MPSIQPIANAAPSRVQHFLTLAFLSLIWGTSFILIKKSVGIYPPEQVGLMRLGLSGLAFLPFLVFQWKKIDWKRLHFFLLVGLCGSGIPAFLFSFAQKHISSSVAGILNSLTPLFTLLLGIFVFRATLIWAKVIGVLIGLVGATLLILFSNGGNLQAEAGYSLLIVLAAVCYATNSNIVGNIFRDLNSLLISSVSFALVGIPAFLILVFRTDFLQILIHNPRGLEGLGYVSILALVGTVLSTIIFFRLIQQTSPVFASTVAYVMPIVALMWGLLDGETVGIYHLLGMALILSGVYLSRK